LNFSRGFEGYVHVSELSHTLLNELEKLSYEKLADVSEDFSFRIIDKEPDDNRLLLSVLKCYNNWLDKWEHIHENYQVENTYNAVVVSIEDERIWVSLEDGVEASINKSEYVWSKVYQSNGTFHIFDNVKIMLLSIDKDKKRITASIKKCEPNPWEITEGNVNPGDTIAFRIIEKRANGYRIYACDNQNLIGTLPSSEVSWFPEDEDLDPNQKYEAKVLELKAKICSLKVSLKSLTPNPWKFIVVGGIIQGTVDSNEGRILSVNLGNGLFGYTDEINLSSNKSPIDFKIIAFDTLSKEIRLSHKRIKFDMEMDTVVKEFFNHTSI
jgi:small subunit ribosomal protein S1